MNSPTRDWRDCSVVVRELWEYLDGRASTADAAEIKACAVEQGMRTLRDDGAHKVLCGMTTIEEVLRVTAEEA